MGKAKKARGKETREKREYTQKLTKGKQREQEAQEIDAANVIVSNIEEDLCRHTKELESKEKTPEEIKASISILSTYAKDQMKSIADEASRFRIAYVLLVCDILRGHCDQQEERNTLEKAVTQHPETVTEMIERFDWDTPQVDDEFKLKSMAEYFIIQLNKPHGDGSEIETIYAQIERLVECIDRFIVSESVSEHSKYVLFAQKLDLNVLVQKSAIEGIICLLYQKRGTQNRMLNVTVFLRCADVFLMIASVLSEQGTHEEALKQKKAVLDLAKEKCHVGQVLINMLHSDLEGGALPEAAPQWICEKGKTAPYYRLLISVMKTFFTFSVVRLGLVQTEQASIVSSVEHFLGHFFNEIESDAALDTWFQTLADGGAEANRALAFFFFSCLMQKVCAAFEEYRKEQGVDAIFDKSQFSIAVNKVFSELQCTWGNPECISHLVSSDLAALEEFFTNVLDTEHELGAENAAEDGACADEAEVGGIGVAFPREQNCSLTFVGCACFLFLLIAFLSKKVSSDFQVARVFDGTWPGAADATAEGEHVLGCVMPDE